MKTILLSIMLYKVYVNLCDFRAESYETLGTIDAYSYIYMPFRCSMPNIFAFGLLLQKNIFYKFSLFGPFLGAGAICDRREFI